MSTVAVFRTTLLWAVLAAGASAQSVPEDLKVGQWVQAKGTLDESGVFVVGEIEVKQPEDEETLIGVVSRVVDREHFELLGVRVRISGKTKWKDAELGDLAGSQVRVQGHLRGVGSFSAREISLRGKGRASIEGRIDQLALDGPYLRLSILGLQLQAPADVDIEHEEPLESYALAPARVLQTTNLERDEDEEIAGRLRIGDTLVIGGQIEAEAGRRDNYDLNDAQDRDRSDYDFNLRLEAIWTPTEDFYALASLRHAEEWRDEEDDPTLHVSDTRLSEGYGYWRGVFGWGFDLQVGRQDFEDKREWLYDQNLDAVRLVRSTPDYRLELAAATTLSDGNQRDEDSLDLIAYLSNNSRRKHAALYAIDRSDQELSGEHFLHVGGRAHGEWIPTQQSWLELAGLLGESGGEDLGGLGIDLGSTWIPEAEWAPALTAGWAWGSGDKDPGNGDNGTFRQTGFADNNDKWSGVTSFRYYGELVDPELANLSIVTLGVGKRITRDNSIDLVWHRFDQVEAAGALINTNLRDQPNGVDTYLGWEADLIFGSRAIRYTLIELVLGYFEPGDAFPGGDGAWLGRVQLRYRF